MAVCLWARSQTGALFLRSHPGVILVSSSHRPVSGLEKRFGAAVILASSFDFWSERPQKKTPEAKKNFFH